MSALLSFEVVAVKRGDLDVDTIEEVVQVIQAVVESCDLKSVLNILRSKTMNRCSPLHCHLCALLVQAL